MAPREEHRQTARGHTLEGRQASDGQIRCICVSVSLQWTQPSQTINQLAARHMHINSHIPTGHLAGDETIKQ